MAPILIGDARATDLYNIKLKDVNEAQAIAEIVHRNCSALNAVKPVIYFTYYEGKATKGRCYRDGRITLNKQGQTWGTLAHELAHLSDDKARQSHSAVFKLTHIEVLDMMEAMYKV